MKKCSILIVAAMLATMFVGLTSNSANARPYPGTVKTRCHLANHWHRYHKRVARARAWVSSSSNAKARGKVIVRIQRKSHHRWHTVKRRVFKYHGGAGMRRMGRHHKGTFRYKVRFVPSAHSIFKGCSATSHRLRLR